MTSASDHELSLSALNLIVNLSQYGMFINGNLVIMGALLTSPAEGHPSDSVVPSMASSNSSTNLQPKRLRKPSLTILKEILRTKIKLDPDLERKNNSILKIFLDTFIDEMKKKDEIFALLFQKFYYTGSYYADLRISEPNEYDINLVLKLPLKQHSFEVQYQTQVPSYAKFKLRDAESLAAYPKLFNLLFKDGYLIPEKVRTWMQSVIDKALKDYVPLGYITKIKPSTAGPARTIILMTVNGKIDIDLVPAIQCSFHEKPPGIDGRVYQKVKDDLQCFIVPKPYHTAKQPPINQGEQAGLWRTHFPNAENRVIYDSGCVKPVIKLLKLLRDKEQWKIIASYYLKTVVMWMTVHNSDRTFWADDKLGERFVDALKKLAEYVKKKNIPYFFSSKHNLISKISTDQETNICGRLNAIINDIEKDPVNLWKVFGASPTFKL